ncbi:MAG: hypothetical protein JXQ83_10105 [Candidatus Glassbacteria bacterium]|nr:hypothetical protein [Candidatus Glassbacteria bacterium]
MSCPVCNLDYAEIEEQIDSGDLAAVENLVGELAALQAGQKGAVVVICPSCEEALTRLRVRVASRLRKKTLGNIHNLLDEAYERRRKEKQG